MILLVYFIYLSHQAIKAMAFTPSPFGMTSLKSVNPYCTRNHDLSHAMTTDGMNTKSTLNLGLKPDGKV